MHNKAQCGQVQSLRRQSQERLAEKVTGRQRTAGTVGYQQDLSDESLDLNNSY